jgi:hypothetical protein
MWTKCSIIERGGRWHIVVTFIQLHHAGSSWHCGLSCLSLKIPEMRRNRNLLKETGAGGSKRLNEKGAGTKLDVSV